METLEHWYDDILHLVRVDVHDSHEKPNPWAFQEWLTSLKDYFYWFSILADCRVHFVKVKLKGQARVLLQSVE